MADRERSREKSSRRGKELPETNEGKFKTKTQEGRKNKPSPSCRKKGKESISSSRQDFVRKVFTVQSILRGQTQEDYVLRREREGLAPLRDRDSLPQNTTFSVLRCRSAEGKMYDSDVILCGALGELEIPPKTPVATIGTFTEEGVLVISEPDPNLELFSELRLLILYPEQALSPKYILPLTGNKTSNYVEIFKERGVSGRDLHSLFGRIISEADKSTEEIVDEMEAKTAEKRPKRSAETEDGPKLFVSKREHLISKGNAFKQDMAKMRKGVLLHTDHLDKTIVTLGGKWVPTGKISFKEGELLGLEGRPDQIFVCQLADSATPEDFFEQSTIIVDYKSYEEAVTSEKRSENEDQVMIYTYILRLSQKEKEGLDNNLALVFYTEFREWRLVKVNHARLLQIINERNQLLLRRKNWEDRWNSYLKINFLYTTENLLDFISYTFPTKDEAFSLLSLLHRSSGYFFLHHADLPPIKVNELESIELQIIDGQPSCFAIKFAFGKASTEERVKDKQDIPWRLGFEKKKTKLELPQDKVNRFIDELIIRDFELLPPNEYDTERYLPEINARKLSLVNSKSM
jgi:hypothetical protein